jgi:hypothetical protein
MEKSLRFAAAALLTLAGPLARASNIDDSGSRVVVPFVSIGGGFETRLLITNHAATAAKVQVRWVGERSGAVPGLRVCGTVSIPGSLLTTLDVVAQCGLPPSPGVGMVVLIETDASITRLSARATVDFRSPATGGIEQTISVAGLPLAAIDATDNVHTAAGLRQTVPGAPRPSVTDCYVASFADGSGAGGMVARVSLADDGGNVLGSRVASLRPFELVALRDVFRNLAPTGLEGVRADYVFTGFGDAALGYCVTTRVGLAKQDRNVTLHMAQVAEPRDDVRRRELSASMTPGRGPFLMLPPPDNRKQLHGIYVRQPDEVVCSVSQHASHPQLEIKAFSPDRVPIAGSQPRQVTFGGGGNSTIAGGFRELWGLEVDWPSGTTPPLQSVPYTISCTSGNGTSLADLLAPVAP